MKMPYVVGPPVRLPTDFFGRAGQTRQFFETLAGNQTQSVAVLGLRRAGKTSFLQYVSHPEVMASYVPDSRRYLMIYVDLSACKTAADFYGRVYRKLLAGLSRVPAGVERSPGSADVYDVESLLHEFTERRIVLLLDEFDQIRSSNFDANFLTELRALAGIWEFELAYVTAAYWDNYRLGNFVGLSPTSPFYNIFFPSPIYLSGMSPNEIDELVKVPARRVGVVADDEDVAFVRHYAGTLPFFVQAVAANWLAYKVEGHKPDAQEVTRRVVPEMAPYFEQWWHNFNDVERDVVAAVVQEKSVERLPYGESEIAQAVERLRCYGVISSAGENLWPDSALFGSWLREFTGRSQRKMIEAPPPGNNNPEGGIANPTAQLVSDSNARILQICDEICRQYESLPLIYSRKSDAELRDHLRMSLEGGMKGRSGGLSFIANGNHGIAGYLNGVVAVAAECVTWTGQKGFLRSVDQLLGTSPVPPAGGAIIVIVRNGDPVVVADAISLAMPHHHAFVSRGNSVEGCQKFRLQSPDASQEEFALSVFIVDLSG